MEPGRVTFDTGLTTDDLKTSTVRRQERSTNAKEKREAATESMRLAVLESIDAKTTRATAVKEKRALLPVQKKLLTLLALTTATNPWTKRAKQALVVGMFNRKKKLAARAVQKLWRKYQRKQAWVQAVSERLL